MNAQLFRPRSQNAVEAWRVPHPSDTEALDACAAWARGKPVRGLGVGAPTTAGRRLVCSGLWLVKTSRGLEVFTNDEFEAAYTKEGS